MRIYLIWTGSVSSTDVQICTKKLKLYICRAEQSESEDTVWNWQKRLLACFFTLLSIWYQQGSLRHALVLVHAWSLWETKTDGKPWRDILSHLCPLSGPTHSCCYSITRQQQGFLSTLWRPGVVVLRNCMQLLLLQWSFLSLTKNIIFIQNSQGCTMV